MYRNALVRTPETLDALEEALVLNKGDMLSACQSLGFKCPVSAVVIWMEDDPEVAGRLKKAQLIGWSTLESEAHRRAVQGVEEAVYYQGEVVGYKTVYSDGLLMQMLKARVPAYKPDGEGSRAMVQVNIVPRADSYEDWLRMKQVTLQNKLPAPPVQGIQEVEYEVIKGPFDDLGI